MSCSPCGFSYTSAPQVLMTGQHPSLPYPSPAPATSSGMPPENLPGLCPLPYDGRLLGPAAAYPRLADLYPGYPEHVAYTHHPAMHLYPTALTTPYDMKDPRAAWGALPETAGYNQILAAYSPYGDRFDPVDSEARRRNATRETTSTLKAWLNEHRKNPYPTKGEKIMLAIITKMTLTQVSTWFANARRRLKKENKMTWSPRNRCEDDDLDDRDDEASVRMKDGDGKRSEKDSDADRRREEHRHHHPRQSSGSDDGKMDFVDVDDDCKSCASTSTDGHVITNSSDKENCSLLKRVPSPISDASLGSEDSDASQNPTELPPSQQQQKPRIWSIVDTATSGGPSSSGPPGASPRLSPMQRAAYLSPYPKPPASWYAGALGNLGVVTSVGANFPLSAVYSCPPMGGGVAPSAMESSAAVSSLNRLRTAAAAFPTAASAPGELLLHKAAAAAAAAGTSPSPPSMFSLATSKSLMPAEQRSTPTSSSSAAAIAAMASSAASSVINSGPSAGRVIS